MTTRTLKTVIFMGSARNVIPPWGGKSRLGNGVLSWVVESIKARASQCGPDTVNHEVTVFDPLDVFGPDGALSSSGAEMKCPHFFMKTDEVSPELAAMAATIKAADCFIIVTPEYNHTLPPALTSMMGHFGSSNYAFKPSAIVTYSVGALGGIRAAMAARPFLSELGCLPVSKLAAFGSVGDIFEDDGTLKDPSSRLLSQLPAMMAQLEWFAIACKNQREAAGTP